MIQDRISWVVEYIYPIIHQVSLIAVSFVINTLVSVICVVLIVISRHVIVAQNVIGLLISANAVAVARSAIMIRVNAARHVIMQIACVAKDAIASRVIVVVHAENPDIPVIAAKSVIDEQQIAIVANSAISLKKIVNVVK